MSDYFSSTYEEARAGFQKVAAASGGSVTSYPIPEKGPNGEELAVDIALWGFRIPKRLFVLLSGTHGVEGFAGSAIQLHCMSERLYGMQLPHDSAIVMVHSLNPFGMAWLRRWNEQNVDLNRNFLGRSTRDPTASAEYERIKNLANPVGEPGCCDCFTLKALLTIMRQGLPKTKEGLAGGQRKYPDGLFYGGLETQPTILSVLNYFENEIDTSNLEKVIYIDVHTGLGPYGYDTLLVDMAPDDPRAKELNASLTSLPSRDVYREHLETLQKDGVAYKADGNSLSGMEELFTSISPSVKYYGITQEFGTIKGIKIVEHLRAENRKHQAHVKGGNKHPSFPVNDAVKVGVLNAFNPVDPEWQKTIIERGKDVVTKALALLFKQS